MDATRILREALASEGVACPARRWKRAVASVAAQKRPWRRMAAARLIASRLRRDAERHEVARAKSDAAKRERETQAREARAEHHRWLARAVERAGLLRSLCTPAQERALDAALLRLAELGPGWRGVDAGRRTSSVECQDRRRGFVLLTSGSTGQRQLAPPDPALAEWIASRPKGWRPKA